MQLESLHQQSTDMTHLQLSVLLVMLLFAVTICQNDVRRPPNILIPVRDETVYYQGWTKVVLSCSSDGQPQPTYKWRKDGQDIPTTSYNSTSGSLIIQNFTTVEEGTYMCIATNVFYNGPNGIITASNFSPRTKLFQIRIGPFKVTSGITKQATEYGYFLIMCDNKGEVVVPDIIINWYDKSGKVISLDRDRLYIDRDGNLHFSYVANTDGIFTYSCGILTQDEKQIILGPTTTLTVTASTNPIAIKPQLRYSSTGTKGFRFGSAKLECVFSGYDPAQSSISLTQWYDDSGKEITNDGSKYVLSFAGRQLTIMNLQEEDEKYYLCRSRNSAGDSQFQVFLNVTSGPIFINGAPSNQTVPENVDAKFDCSARSASGELPPSPPVWYKNGELIDTLKDTSKLQLSEDKNILTIKNVTKATDIMCVQCIVSNDVDTVMASACLNVILPITIQSRPREVQEIRHGDSVDMTVTAISDPSMSLNYRWEFENKSFVGNDHPPFMYFNPNNMVAYINTSSLTQEQYGLVGGLYRRVIYHYYQIVNVDTIVVLADRKAYSAGATFDWWIIGLIIGLLLLIVIILLIVFIICRKKQEGDYNVDKKETGAGLDPEKELKDGGFNAYSRPVYDDIDGYPDKKTSGGDPEFDDAPIGGDDESLGEYGKDIYTHFNEDGSFIGVYQSKLTPPSQPTESTI